MSRLITNQLLYRLSYSSPPRPPVGPLTCLLYHIFISQSSRSRAFLALATQNYSRYTFAPFSCIFNLSSTKHWTLREYSPKYSPVFLCFSAFFYHFHLILISFSPFLLVYIILVMNFITQSYTHFPQSFEHPSTPSLPNLFHNIHRVFHRLFSCLFPCLSRVPIYIMLPHCSSHKCASPFLQRLLSIN